jgi:hypothetical protein
MLWCYFLTRLFVVVVVIVIIAVTIIIIIIIIIIISLDKDIYKTAVCFPRSLELHK